MDLAQTFTAMSLQDISGFVANQQEEHLLLDFKTVGGPNLGSRDDRRNFAAALSGFSNSSGGLIVWGVNARKNQQGIDCASELQPINPVQQFLARLNEFTGQALSPISDGVRHKAIDAGQGAGYAVTFVPESVMTPHMAKLGEDRYYKRSGASFYVMEHFDLEDMFGRRQKPRLEIQIIHHPVPDDAALVDLDFRISNVGRAVAKHAGFFARFENAVLQNVSFGLEDVSSINNGRPTLAYIYNEGVIHVNGIPMHAGRARIFRPDASAGLGINVTGYCENAQPVTSSVTVPSYQKSY